MEENTKIEEKLFFTDITENEKRLINLMRTYVVPFQDPSHFIDDVIETVAQKLLDRSLRLKAFTDVLMYDRKSDKSNMELMARIDMFEDYLYSKPEIVNSYMSKIMVDMVENLEGDIKPISVYSKTDAVSEEEKLLDKIKNM
jgi:hypothetical protein